MMALSRLIITRRRLLAAILFAVSLALVFPATSQAHAVLLRSDPAENAVLHAAPDQVHLWFSETLNATLSAVTVFNQANQRVDNRDASLASGDAREMDVTLEPRLPPGVYTVIWRAASDDDGHIVPGSFLFTITRPDGTLPPSSGGTIPGGQAQGGSALSGQLDGPTWLTLFMITLLDLGAVFWVGAHLWQLFVLPAAREDHQELNAINRQVQHRFERRLALPVLLVLLLANSGVLVGQALTITGGNVVSAFAPTLLGTLITSGRFGVFWLVREVIIVLALRLALYPVQVKQRPRQVNSVLSWANLLLGLAFFMAITMSSHAAAVSGNTVVYALIADWLHLVAAALWIGGMLYIGTIYLPLLSQRPVTERARVLVTTLPYYSPWAIAGVVLMAVTGPFSATTRFSSGGQLLTTLYGQVLTLKILLVGALLLTSAMHVFLLRPRLAKEVKKYAHAVARVQALQAAPEQNRPGKLLNQQVKLREERLAQQTGRLTRILRFEPVLGVAVLLCVGLLNVFAGTLAPVKTPSTTTFSPATTKTPPSSTPAITATGVFREYPLPQSDSQIMRLAIDHEGRIWFGEMGKNYLAVFDPRAQTFQQMTPPHGRYGVMGVQVAPDDTIWFVEQYANYIGHYFPATGRYQMYPLPTLTIPDASHPGKTLTLPSAPNELVLDSHGMVWFTEFNADRLGRLDPHTGLTQQYPLAAKKSVQTLLPYGITVDPQGMVWFTEASSDHLGRLDPATGRIRFFTMPGPDVPLMEIASDAHGIIWATSFSSGLLLRLDPRTATFIPYYASFTGKGTGGLYGLVVTPAGEIWITDLAENVIAHLDSAAKRFIYYPLPTPGSEPLAMVMDANQTLWFVEVDKIGMLRP